MRQDITEQRLLHDRTKYLAEFDLMTGLANRSQFQSKLSSMCEIASDGNMSGALLLIDLDGFKLVNDNLGHTKGDEALIEIAKRLKQVCHEADLVARIGGDEFAVLIGPQFLRCSIETLARFIIARVNLPINACGWSLNLGASIGIARTGIRSASEVFNMADSALYAAKTSGKNTYRMYDLNAAQP